MALLDGKNRFHDVPNAFHGDTGEDGFLLQSAFDDDLDVLFSLSCT
jgi:hypothetical protein